MIVIEDESVDYLQFFARLKQLLESHIRTYIGVYGPQKVQIRVDGMFSHESKENIPFGIYTNNESINNGEDINETVEKMIIKMIQTVENIDDKFEGSGWIWLYALNVGIAYSEYDPLKGWSWIPLPKIIDDKRACSNPKGQGNECLMMALMSALHPVDRNNHPERPGHYTKHYNKYNWKKMSFPAEIKDIKQFERNNNITVHVFCVSDSTIKADNDYKKLKELGLNDEAEIFLKNMKASFYCLHKSKFKSDKVVDLLLVPGKNEKNKSVKHYVCINNLSRLLSSQVSKDYHKKYWCRSCLHHFTDEDKLILHEKFCNDLPAQKTIMPCKGEDDIMEFKNVKNRLMIPFTIHMDLESNLKKTKKEVPENDDQSYSIQTEKHIVNSFGRNLYCMY
eukprot:Lithocolla_globosa_v1_NODE_30_length_9033_cov_22.154583.p2 type:complete len:393 gc:universal NODE_30_length_9033_cov_22.154583:8390-7212(-)